MVRFKNRYITIRITDDEGSKNLTLQQTALHKAIQNKVHDLYGDLGQASIKAGFNAKHCNPRTKIAIVKVRHGPHEMVLKALTRLKEIGGNSVTVKTLYTGATIKQCFLFIKRYQRHQVEIGYSKMRTDQERQQLIDVMMTLTPEMKDFK